jgi:hypothetical protein
MDANISEVLGSSEDRAEKKPSGIEVDEDTTIEDFIEG